MKKDRYAEPKTEESVVVSEEVIKKPKFTEKKVRSTIPKLNVRVAPDSTSEALDSISQGQSVTIIDEKDGWGRLKFIDGWVNLKYTEDA